ncbi:MAG: hypothetical protein K2N72_04045 [Oscillospiraceae bacterium]|nr:hypothetical protein [Oscillospiraceae bacterium]
MFSYIGTYNLNNKPVSYVLHCNNCGNETELLAFKDVKKIIGNRLLLNDNTFIACKICGSAHKAPEPILNLYNDIPPSYVPAKRSSQPPKKDDFEFLISAIDWNTWE